MRLFPLTLTLLVTLTTAVSPAQTRALQSSDLLRLRNVGEVTLSPDGSRIAYSIVTNDGPGRPSGDLWMMSVADGATRKFCPQPQRCGGATWSPNGEWIAYHGGSGEQSGLHVAHPDGSGDRFISKTGGTNNPLPTTGA